MGELAVLNITTEGQRKGRIWDYLGDWAGNEPEGVFIPGTPDLSKVIVCYPNPTRGQLFIDLRALQAVKSTLELFDLHGRYIEQKEVRGGNIVELDLGAHTNKGLIILRLSNENISVVEKITLK